MPTSSIIIRTFNEEKHIGNLLDAISKQDYKDHETIIVDSGSTDGTLEVVKKYPVRIFNIDSRDFTFGYSLNIGCKESGGKYLVIVSAHTIPVNERWLSNLVAPFSDDRVAMVYGRHVGHEISKFSEKMDFERIFGRIALSYNEPITYANNANSAIRRDLWVERPFDEYLFGLEDIDWAKHVTGKGHLVYYEPEAVIHHIHDEPWHKIFNRYRREAIAAVRIGLPHPPQSKIGYHWLTWRLIHDVLSSFPNWNPKRLEEIAKFRYYQWKGSRQGWFHDRDLDLDRDRYGLFFSGISQQVVMIEDVNKARMVDIPIPEMKPGDILIKVDYVGICRTDIEILEGKLGYYRDGVANYPIVPGHEFSGVVAKIGANNKYRERFKVGDKVFGRCILSRGEQGERREVGVINHNGAYGKFVIMPGSHVHLIPNNIDQKTATLAEPLAVVLRALGRIKSRLQDRSKVAVIGAGPIGNLCAQVLVHWGHEVTVFDRNGERLDLLKDKVHEVRSSVENLDKFDILIEITGSQEVLEMVLSQSGFDRTILLLGFPYGDMIYNFENLIGQEKVIVGSVGAGEEDFSDALKILPKLDTKAFTETIMPLEEFKEAWGIHKRGEHIKILLKP